MAMFDYRRASKELVFLKGLGMITYIIDCHRHTSLTSYQSEQPPTPLTMAMDVPVLKSCLPKRWAEDMGQNLWTSHMTFSQSQIKTSSRLTINNLATDPLTISWFRDVQTSSVTARRNNPVRSTVRWCSNWFSEILFTEKSPFRTVVFWRPRFRQQRIERGKRPGNCRGRRHGDGKGVGLPGWPGRIPRHCRWALNIFELSIFSGII